MPVLDKEKPREYNKLYYEKNKDKINYEHGIRRNRCVEC